MPSLGKAGRLCGDSLPSFSGAKDPIFAHVAGIFVTPLFPIHRRAFGHIKLKRYVVCCLDTNKLSKLAAEVAEVLSCHLVDKFCDNSLVGNLRSVQRARHHQTRAHQLQ